MDDKLAVELGGIPETLLWPLHCRAGEARRAGTALPDPRAVALVDAVDYPFEQRFGRPHASLALRAACFDEQVRDFLRAHPDGSVVSLGEGLETQFWRVDNGRVRWLSVDLPEAVEVRRALLPDQDRLRTLACSALDQRWMDEVDPSRGVLVLAQGLLMYFTAEESMRLVASCARRFPGGRFLFDGMPRWLVSRQRNPQNPGNQEKPGNRLGALLMRGRAKDDYQLPPFRWGAGVDELREKLLALDPRVARVRDVRFPRGRGFVFGVAYPLLGGHRPVRNHRPHNTLVEFAGTPDHAEPSPE